MFGLLEKYYTESKITQKAIARLGKAYGDIAFYDKASEKLEEYAKKYAGEKDAFDAMSDAVFYRKGIGDDDATNAALASELPHVLAQLFDQGIAVVERGQ